MLKHLIRRKKQKRGWIHLKIDHNKKTMNFSYDEFTIRNHQRN